MLHKFTLAFIVTVMLTGCQMHESPQMPLASSEVMLLSGQTLYVVSTGALSMQTSDMAVIESLPEGLTLTGMESIVVRQVVWTGSLDAYLTETLNYKFEGMPNLEIVSQTGVLFGNKSGALRREKWLAAGFETLAAYALHKGTVYIVNVIPASEVMSGNAERVLTSLLASAAWND